MAFKQRLDAELLFVDVPSPNLEGAEKFYDALFGVRDAFARSLTDEVRQLHMPISRDGTEIHLTDRPTDRQPQVTVAWYGVESLSRTLASLEKAGGKRVAGPFPVKIADRFFDDFKEKAKPRVAKAAPQAEITPQMAEGALVLDPNGNGIGLLELEDYVKVHFRAGKHNQGLREEQLEDQEKARETARKAFGGKY